MKNKKEASIVKEAIKMNKAVKIKESLRKAGINQSQLARKLGLTRGMVSNWISGKLNPKLETLKKISEATDVPLNFFLENSNFASDNSSIVVNQKNYEQMQKEIELLRRELEIERKEKQLLKSSKKE
jgi:transcriptional regulator with XRE-family HTH domain